MSGLAKRRDAALQLRAFVLGGETLPWSTSSLGAVAVNTDAPAVSEIAA